MVWLLHTISPPPYSSWMSGFVADTSQTISQTSFSVDHNLLDVLYRYGSPLLGNIVEWQHRYEPSVKRSCDLTTFLPSVQKHIPLSIGDICSPCSKISLRIVSTVHIDQRKSTRI
ncbi:hypothetical protein TNCV_2338591 [Trichonephila clavipes]|nr:hypothetical protein TNCV_2338591 [Trichonephila clavipes]